LNNKEKKVVTLYSDGSSLGNPGPGGWGVILEYKGHQKELSGAKSNTTNNQMELTAVIKGLQELKEPCNVEIVTDSSYVANAINEWLDNWIKKDFKKVKNKELWLEYIEASKNHNIKATWVKGHSGHPQNERCDKLAVQEAKKIKEKL
jgi:ribonuclease HI